MNSSKESATCDRFPGQWRSSTWKTPWTSQKKKRSEGKHYQGDQRSYGKRIPWDRFAWLLCHVNHQFKTRKKNKLKFWPVGNFNVSHSIRVHENLLTHPKGNSWNSFRFAKIHNSGSANTTVNFKFCFSFKAKVYLQGCLAYKRCSASGLNCRYLNPYIKLKLIGRAIRLY